MVATLSPLGKIARLCSGGPGRTLEDKETLEKLASSFEEELITLKGTVDGLDARVSELEENSQFSTTTKAEFKIATDFVYFSAEKKEARGMKTEIVIEEEELTVTTPSQSIMVEGQEITIPERMVVVDGQSLMVEGQEITIPEQMVMVDDQEITIPSTGNDFASNRFTVAANVTKVEVSEHTITVDNTEIKVPEVEVTIANKQTIEIPSITVTTEGQEITVDAQTVMITDGTGTINKITLEVPSRIVTNDDEETIGYQGQRFIIPERTVTVNESNQYEVTGATVEVNGEDAVTIAAITLTDVGREATIPEYTVMVDDQMITIPERKVMITNAEQTNVPLLESVQLSQDVTIPEQTVMVDGQTVMVDSQEITIPEQTVMVDGQEITIPEQTIDTNYPVITVEEKEVPYGEDNSGLALSSSVEIAFETSFSGS
ncbi:MAG: hypothetical protein OXH24_05240, partial [Cyanobacteria bacterium MAG IRC3_bin_20]|nr:hypothetical protein [Cyanobacteria bacterium MAG IRC3_bin_20]